MDIKDLLEPENCPEISPDLLEMLERLYPARCPDPDWEDRQIWVYVGRRQVVEMLRWAYERQKQAQRDQDADEPPAPNDGFEDPLWDDIEP